MFYWMIILLLLTITDCLSIGEADEELENDNEEENEANKTMARNFTILRTKYDKGFISRKKITIIFILLGISFVGAIIVTFINVNEDFNNLHTFYAGYMGRKLVLRERVEENKHFVSLDNDNQVINLSIMYKNKISQNRKTTA